MILTRVGARKHWCTEELNRLKKEPAAEFHVLKGETHKLRKGVERLGKKISPQKRRRGVLEVNKTEELRTRSLFLWYVAENTFFLQWFMRGKSFILLLELSCNSGWSTLSTDEEANLKVVGCRSDPWKLLLWLSIIQLKNMNLRLSVRKLAKPSPS